ncbi:hypothetical protein LI325_21895 [Enterocloster lavalensis]|nr:flavodoxin [Enterocloster lavalensis]MCB6345458.1 hypothetical protein [Enterocloster lavalensis]
MQSWSFLEQYDLSGKTIVPFVTSGGSGFSNPISTIADLQPNMSSIWWRWRRYRISIWEGILPWPALRTHRRRLIKSPWSL